MEEILHVRVDAHTSVHSLAVWGSRVFPELFSTGFAIAETFLSSPPRTQIALTAIKCGRELNLEINCLDDAAPDGSLFQKSRSRVDLL